MKAEAVALVVGMGLLTLAAALIDVRLGLAVGGVLLIVSALDFRGVRR